MHESPQLEVPPTPHSQVDDSEKRSGFGQGDCEDLTRVILPGAGSCIDMGKRIWSLREKSYA